MNGHIANAIIVVLDAARAWRKTRGSTGQEWNIDKEGWRLALAIDAFDRMVPRRANESDASYIERLDRILFDEPLLHASDVHEGKP